MFPRAAILVTCSQSSLLVPSQVPEWTSQHLLWHGRLQGKRSRSAGTGCCCFGGGAGGAGPSLPKLQDPCLVLEVWIHLGSTWCKGGAKHRESVGMEWVGDRLVSSPPTSLAGCEPPSRLVALSISYKNVLVIYWFWWQALAGVAMLYSELAKLNHTAQLGGVATVTFPPSSTHPMGQKLQLAALQREEVLRNTVKTIKTATTAKSLDVQLTQHPALCVYSL